MTQMRDYNVISYIFGLSTMFFGMMAVSFWRRGERLHKLVALLTGVIAVQCIKDFIVASRGLLTDEGWWEIVTAIDMVAVSMYAFVLTELVRPGQLTLRSMLRQEIPFVVLPLAYIATQANWIFYLEVAWAAVYGTGYLIWTAVHIPRYNRHLKECYSYTENVNLGWLSVILYTFYVILGLWILDCVFVDLDLECAYMLCNLTFWMVISYFLSRHESVLNELSVRIPERAAKKEKAPDSALSAKIEELFAVQRIFLSPNLKLSDVARAAGSNRTYVSNFFNRDAATSFYDYVNAYRVAHACTLLAESEMPVQEVALKCGFNSASVFSRVFTKLKGCTPSSFREQMKCRTE